MHNKGSIYHYSFLVFWVFTLLFSACGFAAKPLPPAQPETLRVEASAGVTEEETRQVEQIAKQATSFFTDSGLKLTQPITIVLTRDRKSYLAAVVERFGISELEAQKASRGTDALSGSKLMVVHLDGIPTPRQKAFLLTHELTHFYQRQLAGGRAGQIKWLLEGMADASGARMVERLGYFTVAEYQRNWQSGLRQSLSLPELADLHSAAGWSAAIARFGPGYTYKTAGLAALLLEERYGQDKLWQFYTLLGQGEDADIAFRLVFGIGLTEFETEFSISLKEAA